MKNILKTSFLLLIISVAFISCQKKKEIQVDNTWRLIKVAVDTNVTWYEAWKFDNGDITILKKDNTDNDIDTIGNGKYTVVAKLSKSIITMREMHGVTKPYNGDWKILKLNDDVMIILNQDNGWYYREFIKK